MYVLFNAAGLQYGPEFRKLAQVWAPQARGDVLGALHRRSSMQSLHVHPADLDCTQHLELLMPPSGATSGGGPHLPFAYDKVTPGCAKGELLSVRHIV